MTAHGPRRRLNRSDLVGGLFHLIAEMGALAVLGGILAFVAWILLLLT